MVENFAEEENLEISSNQQNGKVDSPTHCLNLGASYIILVGGQVEQHTTQVIF